MTITELAKQWQTVIHHKPPIEKDPTSNDLLILIPGNPGLVNFYICYLDLIQQQFPNFEILCISHAGCDPNSYELFKFYGLKDQIVSKYEIIKKFVMDNEYSTKYNLYFLSHSVGCYINQRMVKLLLDDMSLVSHVDIKYVGLICPTIKDISKSVSGVRITKLFNYTPIITVLSILSSVLTRLLSDNYLLGIIEHYHIIKKPALVDFVSQLNYTNSTLGALNIVSKSHIVKQVLTLACEEMKLINEEKDINDWFFHDLGSKVKVWVYFADSDHWVNDKTRDELIKDYYDEDNHNNIRFELGKSDDGITHSFCIDKSVEFARITTNAIRRLN
ncbi:hypothetical protein DFJ63DRAFT_154391 [Scheffersomyces coipomensis]|uniref:uncharacterized protein n=1 Tax=Scheffersomyces coipomensis TaxID=1788519 RepID=UPI00315CD939